MWERYTILIGCGLNVGAGELLLALDDRLLRRREQIVFIARSVVELGLIRVRGVAFARVLVLLLPLLILLPSLLVMVLQSLWYSSSLPFIAFRCCSSTSLDSFSFLSRPFGILKDCLTFSYLHALQQYIGTPSDVGCSCHRNLRPSIFTYGSRGRSAGGVHSRRFAGDIVKLAAHIVLVLQRSPFIIALLLGLQPAAPAHRISKQRVNNVGFCTS